MDLNSLFEAWRQTHRTSQGWGLAWYLACEIAKRYYSSHGIVPYVMTHDGIGFNEIQFEYLPCPINGSSRRPLGRVTQFGNVENWVAGDPGDHSAKLTQHADNGETAELLVAAAIRHLNLPVKPEHPHSICRHYRWGASYVLAFEVATMLALRNDTRIDSDLHIWNHPKMIEQTAMPMDPLGHMKEHPGHFLIRGGGSHGQRVLISGDGRCLYPVRTPSLWERYMHGESPYALALDLEKHVYANPGDEEPSRDSGHHNPQDQ